MAKKELNAKKIVMEVILVLVLIIGIILLLGVFGKNASTLDDIETSLSNTSNKVTNTKEELNKELDNVLEDVIALETVTNKNYNNTKKQITNLKVETNKTIDELNGLLNEKTIELLTSVDNSRETVLLSRDTILLNNKELSKEITELISTENGIVNANVDALRTDLLNVQTNLQLVNETVGGIVSGYLEKIIKQEVSSAKAEMHIVGNNVLTGVVTTSELLTNHINNHFGITNGKIDALETNLKTEVNKVGATVLSGIAASNYEVLSGVVGALNNNFAITNGKIDELKLSTTEINTAVSTLNTNLSAAKDEIISKIGANYSLIESETGKILNNLSKVEGEIGNISTLLGTMDGKLDKLLENTQKTEFTTIEMIEIIDKCGDSLTEELAVICTMRELGYEYDTIIRN